MSVPTGNIGLSNVTNEIYGDYWNTRNLRQCFIDATGTFDPVYQGSKDSLSNFQNYNHALLPLVYDYDGNPYQPIRIGTQIWLNSCFKCTHLNNGTVINSCSTALQLYNYAVANTAAYYNYASNDRYYNKIAIMNANFAISGWHVPTYTDLNTLGAYLGGGNVAGGHLKKTGTTRWSSNVGADNSTGFNGEPSGYSGQNAIYEAATRMYFWTTTQHDIGGGTMAWYMATLYAEAANLGATDNLGWNGLPVRLIKN